MEKTSTRIIHKKGDFMIKHIVMWTIKDNDDKLKNMEQMKMLLENLKNKIDIAFSLEVGINEVQSPGACDIVLNSEFESLEDLNKYATHPSHMEVVEFIKSVCETRHAVDYSL